MLTTYLILEKYKNYLEKCDGLIIPKFVNQEQSPRGDFLKDYRDLYKRYDNQLFNLFEYDSLNLLQD